MECRVLSCGGAKGRHAKTRKSHRLVGFRVSTFRVFAWRGEMSPRENPPNSDFSPFGGFSRGAFSRFRLAGRKIATRKPAKWWFRRVFAWRPFAPPGKDTTNRRRKGDAWKVSYFRVAGRKVAMRKHEKVTIWRVFAWRLFAFSPRKHDNTKWHKS